MAIFRLSNLTAEESKAVEKGKNKISEERQQQAGALKDRRNEGNSQQVSRLEISRNERNSQQVVAGSRTLERQREAPEFFKIGPALLMLCILFIPALILAFSGGLPIWASLTIGISGLVSGIVVPLLWMVNADQIYHWLTTPSNRVRITEGEPVVDDENELVIDDENELVIGDEDEESSLLDPRRPSRNPTDSASQESPTTTNNNSSSNNPVFGRDTLISVYVEPPSDESATDDESTSENSQSEKESEEENYQSLAPKT